MGFLETHEWEAVPQYSILSLAIFVIALLYLNLALKAVLGTIKKCRAFLNKSDGERSFTNVRIMRNYKVEPEEENAELRRGNVNIFTVRCNHENPANITDPQPHTYH